MAVPSPPDLYNLPGVPFEFTVTTTQVVGVPASIGFTWTLPDGQILIIDTLVVVMSALGANRSVDCHLLNTAGNRVHTLINLSIPSGQFKQLNFDTSASANKFGVTKVPVIIYSNMGLKLNGASLADAEVMTLEVIGRLIAARLPTHGVAGSGKHIEMVGAGIVDGVVANWL